MSHLHTPFFNTNQALANLTQPYLANQIGIYFDEQEANAKANHEDTTAIQTARVLTHSALGIAVAYVSGNNPTSGGVGAATGEAIAILTMQTLYPNKTPDQLTVSEKENIRAIANGAVTSYGYDSQGRKASQRNAEGRTTQWGYTDFGRLSSETLPMGQSKSYAYDTEGKQTQLSDYFIWS